MKIQMEPTENIVKIDGVECRLWNAVTEKGSRLCVLVHSIAALHGEVDPADQKELNDQFEERYPLEITRI